MAKKDKVVKRNDGVNGIYSKETLDNGSTIELLSRRNPNESVTYTERFITPQQDTSYYIYNNTTPDMDRHVIGGKYVTPTKYNKMGWLGKRIIAGVRPDSWDAKFDSYQEPVDSFQPGGSIASRLWNKWTGNDTYVDGYGTTRSHTPVRESAHRTVVKAADSPLVQAIPVVGDIADGYVAADYAAKGDYKPAMAAVGAGLVLPNAMEVAARIPSPKIYREGLDWAIDKVDDFVDVLGVKPISKKSDDLVEAIEPTPSRRRNRTSDKRFDTMHDNDPAWIPEEVTPTEGYDSVFGYDGSSQSNEPWWGWDPVEYQKGGEIPSDDQQQQLFVAIITDMAKTLGVEPSQELAEAVMAAFENNDDSQGLLTLFTKTKDKFMNETGLFREGGKMIAFVEKFKCGGKSPKKKTSKKQEGGEVEGGGTGYLTTPVNDRQMRRNWREATGGTRREARQAQRNLTNYIEGQGGISHGGARNAAAAMMGDPQRFAAPTQTPTLKPMDQAQINVPTPTLSAPKDIADMNYDHLGFNQAFGRARGNGVNTFNWRGKEYTTELAQPSGPANPPSTTGGPSTGHGSRIGNWLDNWRARRNR